MFSFIPVFPSTGILFSCSHHSILVLFHSYFYFIYISIISISFLCSHILFSFYSGLVSFLFLFYLCSHILFLLYSVSPEFCVHFTKKMRPNGEELPKLCLCYIGRHKLMHCDIVMLVNT